MSMKPGQTRSPSASIDAGGGLVDRADGDDPVAADADVGSKPRVAGAVDDAAACE